MNARLLSLSVCCLAALSCVHLTGEKGGLVPVKASADEVQKAFSGRRFALLVGIPQGGDEHWQPLRFARKDVDDLGAVLQDPLRGRFASVVALTTPEQTTRAALEAALARFAALATQPDDVLVLYVSAHGTLARDARGELERFLVTSDADFHHVAETALRVDRLASGLSASKSRRRVVVLATCHSGSGKSLLPDEVVAELASLKGGPLRPLEEVSRANIVLSASDFLETAREDETLQNDVYTHFLVEALSGGGDRNGDGAVTATEAHDFARRRTYVFSQGRQRPAAELVEVGADPVVLTGDVRRTGSPELYSYVPRLDGFSLRVDGEERAELPGGAAVGAGAHRVELTKGGEVLLSEEVRLAEGERLDVDSLQVKHEPFVAMTLTGGAFGFVDSASRQQLLPVAPAVRLQDVAKAVGVSHPTVLHHFGSREGLIEAVVARAIESIQAGLFEQVVAAPGTEGIQAVLDRVAAQMKDQGRARTLMWLALAGYGPGLSALHIKPIAEAVHEVRRVKRAGKKRMPPFEDSCFCVVLPALALLSLSVMEQSGDPGFDVPRFRAWLARLVHHHLERE